jgi:hypothetical protein
MRPKIFLVSLVSGIWLLASQRSAAQTDVNANGLGDFWEKLYNGNSLFSATDPAHAPTADADSDGWTNLQESTAGTNPFSATGGQGMLTPSIAYTPAIREPAPPGAEIGQPGVVPPPTDPTEPGIGEPTYTEPLEIRRPARFTLTWQPVPGKAYRLEQSSNLVTWLPTTGFYMGSTAAITYQSEALYSDNTEPPKFFHRIKIEDADNDSDGLTDYEENLLTTDPYAADTDRDGISDKLDPEPLINALQSTWDADAADPSGAALFAAFNFTPLTPLNVQQVTDTTGNARHGIARNQARGVPQIQNPPMANAEGISNHGFQCADTHHFAFAQQNPPINFAPVRSLSFWVKLNASAIDTAPQPIFSYVPRAADSTVPSASINQHVIRAFLAKNAANTGYEIIWRNWQSSAFSIRERWTLDVPSTRIDKRWLNLTFVWQGGGSGQDKLWACYANGVKQTRTLGSTFTLNTAGTTQNTPQDTFLIGADASGGLAGNNLSNIASTFRGTFDRVRFHSTALSQAQVTAIATQDTDGDQLWDTTETDAAAWYDTNSNGKRDPGEINYGSTSPLEWQSLTTDTDEDKLTDVAEQTLGTLINRTDSDGDRLSDGWEVQHSLNPLLATGAHGKDGDPDGDGVSNINEYRYHTKPTQLPGYPPIPQPGSSHDSDGDSSSDLLEFTQGSHGGNPTDKGQPQLAEEKIIIDLGIGDQSDSKSEDYTMVVHEIDPETGDENEHFRLDADGFGEYKTASPDIFRRGHIYTFQIVWNASNRTDSSSGSELLPDLDYTFKVQPQGQGTGFLIDSYDPRRRDADLTKPLLGNNLQNTAPDESTFRKTIQNRRVVLMGVSTISADRMFGASMHVLPGLEDIQLEITNTATQEDFGTHSQLFAKAYESYEAILGHGDNFGKNVADPRVWFIKDELSNVSSIQTYLCCDPTKPHGEMKISATLRGVAIGNIKRSLTGNPNFANLLSLAAAVAEGTGLGFPAAIGGTAPDGVPAAGSPHHWAAPLNIPTLILHQFDENTTLLATGIYNGFTTGLKDDADFVILIAGGIVQTDQWLKARAISYLVSWATDPALRLRQLKEAISGFFAEYVCKPASSISSTLATPSEWLSTFWNAQARARVAFNTMQIVAAQGLWSIVAEGAADWWEDFSNRMMYEPEALVANANPFPTDPLLSSAIAFQRTAAYTIGYSTGYLTEQVVVGYLTAGGITIGKVFLSGGGRISTKLAARTTATIAASDSWLRAYLQGNAALANSVERELYRRGIVLYASEPTTSAIKQPAADIIQALLRKPGFDVTLFNQKTLTEALLQGNLRKLTATTAGENLFRKRTAQLIHLLGDEADAVTMKNYLQVAEERVVIAHPDGAVDEYFEGFFRAFEGNSSIVGNLAEPVQSLSAGAKTRLKAFLSDPNPGYLWKIDDPVFVDGVPQIPQNYWARGVLGELDVFNRVYKKQGYTHAPSAEGYDILGSKWVQIKTTANPSSSGNIAAMKVAIDDLVRVAGESSLNLKLHILKKPGTDSAALQAALIQHADQKGILGRFELLVEPYNIGLQ